MAKYESKTHDFMSVNSFSQLPLIRSNSDKGFGFDAGSGPSPGSDSGSGSGSGFSIRLFGIDCGGEELEYAESNNITATHTLNNTNNHESSRRFECQYCYRNFPTSQALGGHQNAHKRERQHAKRAHLQSFVANNNISNMYGLLPTPSMAAAPSSYPASWNRFYGYSNAMKGSISGGPLSMWRIPASHRNNIGFNGGGRTLVIAPPPLQQRLPLYSGNELRPAESSLLQSGHEYKSKSGVRDNVSLDLHL